MAKTACTVPISQIILDEDIYPRSGVYPKRVSMLAENMRDGFEIGQAIGRSRQTVDAYIADLRAATNMEIDIKIFRMHRLGFPKDRIAKRMGVNQKTIHNHLGEMPELAFLLNTNLSKGFTVPQVAEKHGWAEPLASWASWDLTTISIC